MKIDIKASSMVSPIQETPNGHLWLSNIDLYLGSFHVPMLYLYKKPNGYSFNNFFNAKVLKEALQQVIVPFYPLAGRLGKDEKGRTQINCNGEGVLFIEAETDCVMGDINDFTPSHHLWHLVPRVDPSACISSHPLLLLQVTKFTCGGVSLGIGWHHVLADGFGFAHFMDSWTKTARGLPIRLLPSIDRTFLQHRDPPTPTFHHHEYGYGSTPTTQPNESNVSASELTILKITPGHIHAMKAAMTNNKYTTFEISTAHVWRCACKARGLSNDQSTRIFISVNGRWRLNPPAPSGYFGNIVLHVTATALSGELISEPMENTVKRIHEAINRVDDEYIKSAIDYLEEQGEIKNAMKQSCSNPNIKIVSWMRLPLCDVADFGWGRPIYFRGSNPWEGKGHIMSSPSNDGSLLLFICLETRLIKSFQKLFYEKIGALRSSRM